MEGDPKDEKPGYKSWEDHCHELRLKLATIRQNIGDRDRYAETQRKRIKELEAQVQELQQQLEKASKPKRKRSKK